MKTELQISEKYQDLTEMFSSVKAAELLSYYEKNLKNRSITNSLDFSNKNPPIDPSKSPRSYEHFDPIADRIPRVVVELSSQM
ncbi:hypothetical protein BDDG_13535 [Blastomyces dermatitidis ATCC 18188]|uniref:Uncharacterized protein n=1 Tax=Ajellomyces dermatitidis (strain ATCC 18188 / CBS 674.68) TaxID=653446 RepID=A0A0J9HJK5_AJEDA|nr:hypothetical protein BDDG_13535 [Blastomyces dermatitidis ATCC 18188]